MLLLSVALAAPLATPGEQLAEAVVERVETHPEYERYYLRYPNGALIPAEITSADPEHVGICLVDRLTLFPRADMAEGAVPQVYTMPMDVLCRRLEARPEALNRQINRPGVDWQTQRRVALGLAVGALLTLLYAARRATRWDLAAAVGVVTVAALARWWYGPLGIFNGENAGYEKLTQVLLRPGANPYGDGYPLLMGAFEGWPDAVFHVNRVIATLAPLALWALVRVEAGPRAALIAGLAYALLPSHVGVSGSELMHLPIGLLMLIAALAGAAFRHTPRWPLGVVAGLAAGWAVHFRPDALVGVALPLIWGGPRILWSALPVMAALLVMRGMPVDTGQNVLHLAPLAQPQTWLKLLLPHVGERFPGFFQLFWHSAFTPVTLWALVVAGLARRALVLRALAWVVLGAPVLLKSWPLADALRLQLPYQPAWLVIAGVGGAALIDRLGARRGGALVGGALLWVAWALPHAAPRWVTWQEWAFLREVAPTLTEGTVRFDPRPPRSEKVAEVLNALGPAVWKPWSADDVRGTQYLYRGVSCYRQGFGDCPTPTGPAIAEQTLTPRMDLDMNLQTPVVIGIYRMEP